MVTRPSLGHVRIGSIKIAKHVVNYTLMLFFLATQVFIIGSALVTGGFSLPVSIALEILVYLMWVKLGGTL